MEYKRTQIVVKSPTGRDILFDSIQEAEYYKVLLHEQAEGKVASIECHPSYVLQEPFVYFGKKVNAIEYTPDFVYYDLIEKRFIAIEVKGIPTPDFELRLKLWKYRNPNIEIKVLCYSKGTGWMEQHEYRKARAVLKKEAIEERYARKQAEEKAKIERQNARLEERYKQLIFKDKLSKKERERLEQLKELLGYEH